MTHFFSASTPLTLEHFSQPSTVCAATAKISKLLTLAQSEKTEMVVVVDKQGYPLGAISWRHLLNYLLKYWQKSAELPSVEPVINLRSLMSPMTILSASMSLGEFEQWLEAHPDSQGFYIYGLVDADNQFQGLLDSEQLWRSLLTSSSPENRLSELLEKIPLPLLLGSPTGQILHTNRAWREQVQPHLNPSQVQALLQGEEVALVGQITPRSWQESPQGIAKSQAEYWQASHTLVSQLKNAGHSIFSQGENCPLSPESLPRQEVSNRFWELVKIPLPDQGKASLCLIMAKDVTATQQCCQELAGKNADLVHLNRLKDEFLSCISHELKSPLTAVIGLSTLLKEGKIGSLNTRQTRYAELIYQSGRQLMTLVNDLLDLSRLESGQLKLTPTLVQIHNLCQRAYQVVEEKYRAKSDRHIPFSLEIEPNLEQVVADEVRLQQMLVHLLDNAVKFSEDGGHVGIKVNYWEDWLAFTVWDRGMGIPEEFQPLIFEKFQQLESPLTRQFEGTGLGLVLSQRLAKAHGGDISFISQSGSGSEFTILLPPHPFIEQANPKRQKLGSSSHPLILIVEAIPRAINQLCEQLSQLGYPVVVARSGTEALEKARQLRPRRIFLNPFLPLLSGWDVLNLLKSDPRTATIPVIITSLAENQFRSEQEGAEGFLSLPLDIGKLQELLADFQPPPDYQLNKLTVLQLYLDGQAPEPTLAVMSSPLNLLLGTQLFRLNCRLLEADSLEQAEMIAGVWDVDVVILDGCQQPNSLGYLHELSRCANLASLPLIVLDPSLTSLANQIPKLSVFPCLLSPSEQNLDQLLQVIQIAAQSHG